MENHVFKPHYRHGHHHHKNRLFYALLTMVFFALIATGVVASIYYTLGGESRNDQNQPTTNNGAAGTCLVGTVDCNDTPNTPTPAPSDDRVALQQPAADTPTTYVNSDAKYQVEVPAGLEVRGFSSFDVYMAEPESKWVLSVTAAPNAANLILDEAFQNLFDENRPPTDYQGEYTLADMKTSNMRLNGVAAKRLSISNFGDGGATMIVAVNDGYIYTIRGSLGELYEGAVPDVLDFAQTFRFID